jgi:hypothetical protein
MFARNKKPGDKPSFDFGACLLILATPSLIMAPVSVGLADDDDESSLDVRFNVQTARHRLIVV